MSKLIWITGLAGSGKTTIGNGVFKKIKEKEINTVFIDGDQSWSHLQFQLVMAWSNKLLVELINIFSSP